MNDIAVKQNQPEYLKLLKAQRRLYFEEKLWIVIWMIVSIFVALIGSGVFAAAGVISAYITIAYFAVAVSEFFILHGIDRRGEDAARIQEVFDTCLLELHWNTSITRPADATINAAADRYERLTKEKEKQERKLTNWYGYFLRPDMPLYQARVACQMENLYWEQKGRRESMITIRIVLILLALLLVIAGVAQGWTIVDLLAPLFLLAPVFYVGVRHLLDHEKAIRTWQELNRSAENLWEYVQSPDADEKEAEQRSYDLQQCIYQYRASNPPVLDSFYNRIKKRIDKEKALAKP